MPRISQREARRLKKRVDQLERLERERRSVYVAAWPGGVNIRTDERSVGDPLYVAIDTARRLNHAVVCLAVNQQIRYFAMPLPESPV